MLSAFSWKWLLLSSSVVCPNRWAHQHQLGALLVRWRGEIFSQAPTVEEVSQTGEVILYAAGWRTWSQMLSDPVCGGNKMGIRCTFKLPWRMPSRDVFISCCLGRRKCRDFHWPKHSPIENITYSHSHSSELCNEQLINPFKLSHILSQPHWAALWCVEYQPSMSTGSTLMRSEKTDWMEALQQVLWPIILNSAGILFAF